MNTPAFTTTTVINGMFTTAKVGNSSFAKNNVETKTINTSSNTVRMVVDPFQRKFQSIGKINIDYSRPKKLASYVRGGYSISTEFPNQSSYAGHYSLTNCGSPSGSSKILMKYDEYCAKGMTMVYKRSAVPNGYYTSKCTEATQPHQQAFEKRVFNRTQAFRQAQKPVNVRLREQYENRKLCFVLAHGCSREEDQFKSMPMSCATFLAGRMEAMGTCYRNVNPTSIAEDYMAAGVRAQLTQKQHASGVYRVGVCEDGHAKGDAEARRVAALASEFRTSQQSKATMTGQQYESARTARQLYASCCHHEETQIYKYPAVAAAMCRH